VPKARSVVKHKARNSLLIVGCFTK
jgi:hypothetical protein